MADSDRGRLESEIRALSERGDHHGAATAALRGYGGEILGFMAAMHDDEALVSDAFSTFSESLWRGLPGFAWGSTLRTWAYSIARHVMWTARRDTARRVRRGPRASPSMLDDVADAVRTETLAFLRTETRTRLQLLRDALAPEDRALLILRIDRGLAWNELARVLAEDEGPLDADAIARESARLRKRFQVVKDRLREAARREGLLE